MASRINRTDGHEKPAAQEAPNIEVTNEQRAIALARGQKNATPSGACWDAELGFTGLVEIIRTWGLTE